MGTYATIGERIGGVVSRRYDGVCPRCESKPRPRYKSGRGSRRPYCAKCTREVSLAFSKKHRATLLANARDRRHGDPVSYLLYSARRRAEASGLSFDLCREELSLPSRCPVLGIPIAVVGSTRTPNSPSLDRIDPKRGYVRGNVKVVSWRANEVKRNSTVEELEAVARYIRREAASALFRR